MRACFCLIVACAASTLDAQAALAQPAAPLTCEAKRADIARDLEHARAKHQTQRVRGLEKALRETQAHCSDDKLRREHEARVVRQEKKVAERERELEDARRRGKADKIASREAKLAEERAQLEQLRSGGTR